MSIIPMPIVKPSWRRTLHRMRSFSLLASSLCAQLDASSPSRLAPDRSSSAARPDDPIIATSRWGRPVHRPPHYSPMGISWGSTPQGSPLTNHPSWRRRAQDASAEGRTSFYAEKTAQSLYAQLGLTQPAPALLGQLTHLPFRQDPHHLGAAPSWRGLP
jgi:hypothetical protein